MIEYSVVIPLYNKGPHIHRALRSVLIQTIQNFEIIVIDDGSTDNGPEIVKRFEDPRIHLIQQRNEGVSIARNRGVEESKGNFIALLDADDEWSPIFLETIAYLIDKYPQAGIYATAHNYYQDGKLQAVKYNSIPNPPREGLLPSYFLAVAQGAHPVCSSAVCIPKGIYKRMGGFQKGLWWGEDDELWGRIALKYPIAFSWQVGSTCYKDSVNRACNLSRPIEEHPFVLTAKKLMKSNEVPENMLEDLKECIAKYQIYAAARNVSNGYQKLARDILKNCDTKLLFYNKIYWYFWSMIPYCVFKNWTIFWKRYRGILKS